MLSDLVDACPYLDRVRGGRDAVTKNVEKYFSGEDGYIWFQDGFSILLYPSGVLVSIPSIQLNMQTIVAFSQTIKSLRDYALYLNNKYDGF
jgi:hypothetical protein